MKIICLKNMVGACGQGRWEEEEGGQEEEEEEDEDNGEVDKEGDGEGKGKSCSSMRRSAQCCCNKGPVNVAWCPVAMRAFVPFVAAGNWQ